MRHNELIETLIKKNAEYNKSIENWINNCKKLEAMMNNFNFDKLTGDLMAYEKCNKILDKLMNNTKLVENLLNNSKFTKFLENLGDDKNKNLKEIMNDTKTNEIIENFNRKEKYAKIMNDLIEKYGGDTNLKDVKNNLKSTNKFINDLIEKNGGDTKFLEDHLINNIVQENKDKVTES